MNAYHFAALTALMGVSFLGAGLATVLARRTVENWYRTRSRPEKVPPPPAYGWGWMTVFVLMGAAAWVAWLTTPQWGAPWLRLAMVLYFVMLGLHVVWAGIFFRVDRPGPAAGILIVLCGVTLATLVIFWQVRVLAGALLIPVVVWIAYLSLRGLEWWRHGRHLGGPGAEPAAPAPPLAA